jgi:integrase/recombinase XerD
MRIVAPHAEKTIGSVPVFKPNAHRSVSAFLRYSVGPSARKNRMAEIRWERYPRAAELDAARAWLVLQRNLGLAANTIDAYGRALEEYLAFSAAKEVPVIAAARDHVAAYVRDLTSRPNPRGANVVVLDSGVGLANATLQQRITAIRLFYDYLMEEGLRSTNPVGRGRYTPGKGFGGARDRGLIPRFTKLPWIPNDEQWRTVIEAARTESCRNRMMLALSYDSALRRGELCGLETSDIDPAHRMVTVRAEITKNRRARVVPYSPATSDLLAAYLRRRRELSRDRGPLFLSESRRNTGRPISKWTWSKVVEDISDRSGVAEFTTHTTRHLCLTDLARANWDVQEIATFAGHSSIQTTLLYIHLSGRELASKLAKGMAEIHAWRTRMLKEALSE